MTKAERKKLAKAARLLASEFAELLTAATWAMHGRNYFGTSSDNEIPPLPGAAVFPLLWLADELESQP